MICLAGSKWMENNSVLKLLNVVRKGTSGGRRGQFKAFLLELKSSRGGGNREEG